MWLNGLYTRVRALLHSDAIHQEIDEEMRFHIDMRTEENIRRGMSPDEARRDAERRFGRLTRMKEQGYEVRGGRWLESFWQDCRYGLRSLRKSPGFTAAALLTLALGIGANTAIFSVVNELLLRPMPYGDAERIVMLWEVTPSGRHQNNTSRSNFIDWREQSTAFESMAAFSDQRLNLTGIGDPEEVSVQLASPSLFNVLGVQPLLGRAFIEEDGRTGSPDVVVLGYGIWQRRFGGDPAVVGKSISLNGSPYTVIGVLPRGFQWYMKQRSGTGRPSEIWTVLPMPTEGRANLRGRFLSVVARLKPGATLQQAEAEMKTVHARLEQNAPEFNKGFGVEVIPLRDQLVGNVRPALLILLGAVGFVLLIACANVANLMLSRASAREKEIALRTALGASRMRIVRQLLTESLLLALLGSLLGLALAWWGIKAFVAISPPDLLNLQGVGLNLTVLAWTLAISVVTGIIFGIAPALEATRTNHNDALKEGGKGAGGQSTRSRQLRGALVIAEVALALVLLVSAGLMVKSFDRMQRIETGFNTENVLTMVVRLPNSKYSEDPQIVAFFRQAMERIRALPGVSSAGMVNYLPLYGGLGSATGFTVEGRPALPPGERQGTNVRVADASYFKVMGIPLMRGRNFTDQEDSEARHVILINESMARQHFPGEDPIGKRISVSMFEEPVMTEIVGIVGDVKYDSLVDKVEPTVYFPHPELTYPFMTLVIRSSGDAAALAPAVQREIRAIDPDQPVSDVRTMTQVMSDTVGRARFNTLLLGIFAGLATVLAAIGIYGVLSYAVTQRRNEIGVRMALGAQARDVLRMIIGQGLTLVLIGVGLGLIGAVALTRVMASLLYGVSTTDPLTFAAIALILTVVSLVACYIPARRATRVDPLEALRYE